MRMTGKVGAFPPADVTIEHIGDLLDYDLPRLTATSPAPQPNWRPTQ